MQVTGGRGRRTALLAAACAVCAISLPAPSAHAAVERAEYTLTGPGTSHKGRPVNLAVLVTNVPWDPGMTPDMVDRVAFRSRAVKFDGRARGLAVCDARVPNDGNPAECPRRSQVGSGRVDGILGTPGTPADTFGVLSNVSGRYRLYNYTPRPGQAARMIAVVKTIKPFPGLSINLTATVSHDGEVLVRVPPISKLPTFIRKAYPAGTELVMTRLTASVGSSTRAGRRFATSRRINVFDAMLRVDGN